MPARTIKVVIQVEGATKGSKEIDKLAAAQKREQMAIKAGNAERRKEELHRNRVTKAAKQQNFIIRRLQASYLAGNLAARAISATMSNLAGALKFGVGAAISFEFTMTKISAISSIVGRDLASLEKTIRAIAKVSPKTSTEVAQAALDMSKMGLAGKELEQSLKGVVGLSVALDEEVSTVGQTMVSVKNVFQKDASELTEIADKMFTTLGSSALNLNKFSTAFSFSGASARIAGVSFEQLSALMGVLADNGIKASTIGTQLRQVFTRLDDSSSKVSKTIGAQSLRTRGLKGTLEALIPVINESGDAKKFFGQRAISVVDILLKNIDQIEILTDKTERMTKKTDEASEALGSTMAGEAKKVTSAFEDLNIELSKMYAPIVKVGLSSISSILNEVTSGIQGVGKSANISEKAYALFFQTLTGGLIGGIRGDEKKSPEVIASELAILEKQFRADNAKKRELAAKALAEENARNRALNESLAQENKKNLAKRSEQRARDNENDHEQWMSEYVKNFNESLNLQIQTEKDGAIKLAKDKKNARKASKAVGEFTSGSLGGKEQEIAELLTQRDNILAMEGVTVNQRLEVHKSYLQQKKDLDRKYLLSNITETMSNVSSLAGAFNTLGQIQTNNAVKRAEAEGKSEEEVQAIRRKGFEDQKKWQYAITAMNTAAAIMQVYADPSVPTTWLKHAQAGIIGTTGFVQMASINAAKFASGFDGQVSEPTMFMAGEEGPENVMVTPRSKTGKGGAQGNTVVVNVNGDVFGEEKFLSAVRTANEELDRRTV